MLFRQAQLVRSHKELRLQQPIIRKTIDLPIDSCREYIFFSCLARQLRELLTPRILPQQNLNCKDRRNRNSHWDHLTNRQKVSRGIRRLAKPFEEG